MEKKDEEKKEKPANGEGKRSKSKTRAAKKKSEKSTSGADIGKIVQVRGSVSATFGMVNELSLLSLCLAMRTVSVTRFPGCTSSMARHLRSSSPRLSYTSLWAGPLFRASVS